MVGITIPKHAGLGYLGKVVEQARRSKQINSWLRSVPKCEILNPKLVISTTVFFLVCCTIYRINNRNFAIRSDYNSLRFPWSLSSQKYMILLKTFCVSTFIRKFVQ